MDPTPHPLDDLRLTLLARPLVLIALSLALGVVVADVWPLPLLLPVALVGVAGAVAVLSRRPGPGLGGLLLGCAGLGMVLHTLTLTPAPGDVCHRAGSTVASAEGQVVNTLYETGFAAAYLCSISSVTLLDGTRERVSGLAEVELGSDRAPLRGHLSLDPTDPVTLHYAQVTRTPAPTNWCQSDRRRRLARRRVFTLIRPAYIERAERAETPQSRMVRALAGARGRMTGLYHQALPGREEDAELLAAMVFGDQSSNLSDDTRELFRHTGTIHLLVVSGAQVSIIVGFVALLSGARRRLLWWHVVIIVPLLLWFGLIAGMGASIARSLIMCALWMIAMMSGRQYDLTSSIALSVIILVLSGTAAVFDIGAQLTYAATIGVAAALAGGERLRSAGLDGPQRVRAGVAHAVRAAGIGTLGAWLLTTPLLTHYFLNCALLGSLANLVAVPLSGAIVIAGLLAVLVAPLSFWLARAACDLGLALITIIRGVNWLCAHLPLSFLDNVYLSTPACLAWMAGAGIGLYLVRSGAAATWWQSRRTSAITFAVAGAVVLVAGWGVRDLWPRPARIVAFDVGDGQCSLIETPERQAVLIDAGGRAGLSDFALAREVLLPYLVQHGHRRVDLLIVTHPDSDHYGAARQLARRMPIPLMLTNGEAGANSWGRFLQEARRNGTQIRVAQSGTRAQAGRVRFEILSPPPPDQRLGFPAGDNNHSLLVRAQVGGITALFPGDLETSGMRWVVAHLGAEALAADFLQVPHHGRKSADLPEFFADVHPQLAVVSRAGEPLERPGADACAQAAKRLLSTEDVGAVMVQASGGRIEVKTYRRDGR